MTAGRLGPAFVDYGLGNFVFYNESGDSGVTGVLAVTATGRDVDSYTWKPARIQGGIPHLLSGDAATQDLNAFNSRRSCTDLTPYPTPRKAAGGRPTLEIERVARRRAYRAVGGNGTTVSSRPSSRSYAEGVEGERDEVVLADREHQVHALLLVVGLGQRRPRRVADRRGVVQLVDRAQDRGVVRRPAGRVGADADARDLRPPRCPRAGRSRRAGPTRRASCTASRPAGSRARGRARRSWTSAARGSRTPTSAS